jgi:hypothetical protein
MENLKTIKKKYPQIEELVKTYRPRATKVETGVKDDLLGKRGWCWQYWESTRVFYIEHEYYFVFDGDSFHFVPASGIYQDITGDFEQWSGVSIGQFCAENGITPQAIVCVTRRDKGLRGKSVTRMTIYQL